MLCLFLGVRSSFRSGSASIFSLVNLRALARVSSPAVQLPHYRCQQQQPHERAEGVRSRRVGVSDSYHCESWLLWPCVAMARMSDACPSASRCWLVPISCYTPPPLPAATAELHSAPHSIPQPQTQLLRAPVLRAARLRHCLSYVALRCVS